MSSPSADPTSTSAGRRRREKQGAAAALLNGLTVLEAFSQPGRSTRTVTEVAEIVGLHKSTVSRMLGGLAEANYLRRDERTGRFGLGLGLLGLASPLLAELDVRRAALPHLEAMTGQTRETSVVALWNGAEVVVVEQVASPHFVKHSATIGTRYRRVGSSSVQVMLAEMAHTEVQRMLESGAIEAPGYRGPHDPIHARLAQVSARGYAINDGQTDPEEFSVSAPVRDYHGSVVACVISSAPRGRVQRTGSAEELLSATRRTARRISEHLGQPRPSGDD